MRFLPAPLATFAAAGPAARLRRRQRAARSALASADHLDRPAQRADRARHQAARRPESLRAPHPEPASAGAPVRPHRGSGPRRISRRRTSSPPSAPCIASPASRLAEAGKRFAPRVEAAPAPPHRRPARRREPGLQLPARCMPPRFGAKLARARQGERRRAARHAVAPHAAGLVRARLRSAISGRAALRVGRRRRQSLFRLSRALADAIVVTEDSVNMVTEAAGTGKPVYVQALPGPLGQARPLPPPDAGARRDAALRGPARNRGATRPINDTEMVASAIRRALGLETKG